MEERREKKKAKKGMKRSNKNTEQTKTQKQTQTQTQTQTQKQAQLEVAVTPPCTVTPRHMAHACPKQGESEGRKKAKAKVTENGNGMTDRQTA